MALVWIGDDVMLDNTTVLHVQDTDRLQKLALVGSVDENGIVWKAEWVETERLTRIRHDSRQP